MRTEKASITDEYRIRLNSSPFFIAVDYRGLKVSHFAELRRRLRGVGGELHVVKNSIFGIAAKEIGVADLGEDFKGQMAVVTGQKDVSATAKVIKTFAAEFEKPKIKLGYLNSQKLDAASIMALADLPSIEVLRGKILGLIQAPASQLARVLSAPASQLARVIQARAKQSSAA